MLPGSVMLAVASNVFAVNFPVSVQEIPGAQAGALPEPVSVPDGYA